MLGVDSVETGAAVQRHPKPRANERRRGCNAQDPLCVPSARTSNSQRFWPAGQIDAQPSPAQPRKRHPPSAEGASPTESVPDRVDAENTCLAVDPYRVRPNTTAAADSVEELRMTRQASGVASMDSSCCVLFAREICRETKG